MFVVLPTIEKLERNTLRPTLNQCFITQIVGMLQVEQSHFEGFPDGMDVST